MATAGGELINVEEKTATGVANSFKTLPGTDPSDNPGVESLTYSKVSGYPSNYFGLEASKYRTNRLVRSSFALSMMPIPAAKYTTSPLTLPQLPPVESVRSRLRGHGRTGWPITRSDVQPPI
jgi:hypothetical protein